jgi:hypothetical protein
MSNIKVHKSNGEVLEVTLLTLFGMLADQHSYLEVLARLLRGGRMTVELQDGTSVVERLSPHRRAPFPPLGEFTANVRLHLELPARIHCRADTAAEGRHLIEETINGSIGLPQCFRIEINPTDLEALLADLNIGSVTPLSGVDILNIHQRLRLSHEGKRS